MACHFRMTGWRRPSETSPRECIFLILCRDDYPNVKYPSRLTLLQACRRRPSTAERKTFSRLGDGISAVRCTVAYRGISGS